MDNFSSSQRYVTIREASKVTGLSQGYLRQRCRERTIPVLHVGNRYMILLPALLQVLADEANAAAEG